MGNSPYVSLSLNKGDDDSGISEKESSQESNSNGVNNEVVPGYEEIPCSSKKKTKLVIASYKKCKIVRSQNQALSHMAKGLEDLASSQIKRANLMIESDWKENELFLKDKEEEANWNREHELRLTQIYATALANSTQNCKNNNWQMHHIPPADQGFQLRFMSTPAQSTASKHRTSSFRNGTHFYNHDIREWHSRKNLQFFVLFWYLCLLCKRNNPRGLIYHPSILRCPLLKSFTEVSYVQIYSKPKDFDVNNFVKKVLSEVKY